MQTTPVPKWLLAILVLSALAIVLRLILLMSGNEQADWQSYTSDTFYNLRWRWRYFGEQIGSLASFCPHCDFQVCPQDSSAYRAVDHIAYHCESCNVQLSTFEQSPDSLHDKVERLIQQRIRQGTWRVAAKG